MTHLEGAHSSHPQHNNTVDCREHIEATEVPVPRMRELQDGPFLADHAELQKHAVRK